MVDALLAYERISCAYNLCCRSRANNNLAPDDPRYWRAKRLLDRLVNISSSDTPEVEAAIFKWLGRYGSVREKLNFKKAQPLEGDRRITRCMKVINSWKKEGRMKDILWRVEVESAESIENGWYLIMDTLTLDRHCGVNPREVFCSRGWHVYKQRWREIVRKSCGFDRKVKQREYLWYFGCVQFGDTNTNPHIHVLWGCRKVPEEWLKDPNCGLALPNRREIDLAKTTWKYGYSTPIAVRTSLDDIYARHGWVWPVDDDGVPLLVLGAYGAACYIGRYMGEPEKGEWKCRTRMSQGLGLRTLKQWLKTVPTKRLKILSEMSQVETFQDEWKNRTHMRSSLLSYVALQERLERASRCRARLTLRVIHRNKLQRQELTLKLHEALQEALPEEQFSVCSEWLADVVRRKWVVYDNRAERDLKFLIETAPLRKRDVRNGIIGRSSFGTL